MPASAVLPASLRGERLFHWRGGAVSRIEALSDAVFALVLTLLAVSLEVPDTAAELSRMFWQFPAFAVSFAFLLWVWWEHFLFHRRFGFEGAGAVALNGLLLFFVVFFVYPMKFLATALVAQPLAGQVSAMDANGATVLRLFSVGFVGIFLTFSALYWSALRRREALELDAAELVLTRGSLRSHLLSVGIGCTSLLISWSATTGFMHAASGLVYCLMGPLHGLLGYRTGRAAVRAAALS